jgi:hypothetical protein
MSAFFLTMPTLSFPETYEDGKFTRLEKQAAAERIVTHRHVVRHLENPQTSWVRLSAAMLAADGEAMPDSDGGVIRAALSSVNVSTAMAGLVNTAFIKGFDNQPDNTEDWVRIEPAENFLEQHAFTLLEGARLDKAGKNAASHTFFGFMGSEGWAVARYSAQLVIDEQDLVMGQHIGLKLRAFEELGRAARRVVPDMVFALLLQNPIMSADGNQLFSTAHNNIGTGAASSLFYSGFAVTAPGTGQDSILDQADALDVGYAAIAGQVAADARGDAVHLNLGPKYLIVPPALQGTASRQVHFRSLGTDADLIVRSESRLGPAGVTDPQSDTVINGTCVNWLLAASDSDAPSIVVGSIGTEDGKIKPTIRQFDLAGPGSPGQWGIALDVVLDLGCAALDWRPLYWSAGQ